MPIPAGGAGPDGASLNQSAADRSIEWRVSLPAIFLTDF
jgi:hypothetical protein